DGTTFLPPRLAAARIAADGRILDPGGITLSALTSGIGPAVAAGGGGFAIAWTWTGPAGDGHIIALRVSTAGTVSAPASVCGGPHPDPLRHLDAARTSLCGGRGMRDGLLCRRRLLRRRLRRWRSRRLPRLQRPRGRTGRRHLRSRRRWHALPCRERLSGGRPL